MSDYVIPSKVRKFTRSDVVTYVEWLTFMPNWGFHALPNYYSDERSVVVQIVRTVADSSAPPMYRETLDYPFTRNVTVPLDDVESLDDVGHIILTSCIEWMNDPEMNEHEAREFFRVNVEQDATGTGPAVWRAPFHPHKLSGDREWKRRTGGQSQGC